MDKSPIPFNTQDKPAKAHSALRALLQPNSALKMQNYVYFMQQ